MASTRIQRIQLRAIRTTCIAIAAFGSLTQVARAEEPRPSIHRAVRDNDTDALRRWLAKDIALLNARDQDGMTPLHISICKNRLNAFSFLIASGANVNLATGTSLLKIDRDDGTIAFRELRGQWTPLHLAAYANRLEMAKTLIEKGAKIDPKNDFGETPLYLAAQEGHLSILRMLLQHHPDVNARSTKTGWTPIEAAVFAGFVETGTILQANSADLNVLSAAGLGLVGDTLSLIGKDPALVNGKGTALTSPLYWASMNGQTSVARVLIEKGANIEVKDSQMRTPLIIASITGATNVVHLLADHGAKVDEFDRRGMSALHYAAEFGRVGAAEALLAHGARTDRKSMSGLTPIDIAREKNQLQIIELFDRKLDQAESTSANASNSDDRKMPGRLTRRD